MRILGLFLLGAVAVFGQSGSQASPAPAEVDQALRGRIQIFFQAHADGKPRLADQVVADDSKDFFFEIPKPRYLSFEILKIDYSDEFTKATVTVNCEEELMMMGRKMKVKMPRISTWRLDGGQWVWYHDQKAPRDTPFGKMTPGQRNPGESASPFEIPKGPKPEDLIGLVTADKTAVKLVNPPVSETVTIKNGMPGWVRLVVGQPSIEVPGLEVTLDRNNVAAGQNAILTIRYDPKDQKPDQTAASVDVVVQPLGTVIPIRMVFAAKPPAAPKPAAEQPK